MNYKERQRMWDEYTKTPSSVAIVSSFKALKQSIPKGEVIFRPVMYITEDKPRTAFGSTSLFWLKDISFRYERELRLLRQLGEGEHVISNRKEDEGRYIPVNLRLLVHRVVLNKCMPDSDKKRIVELVRLYCQRAHIQESSL